MNLVLQLTHPCNEQSNPSIGILNKMLCFKWNQVNRPHSKKYIECSGSYIDKSFTQHKNQKIRFWSEWEGPSYFSSTGYPFSNNLSGNPSAIHTPFIQKFDTRAKIVGKKPHNSDPLILSSFADGRIFYSNCKQNKGITTSYNSFNGRKICLTNVVYDKSNPHHKIKSLASHSIIIFGCRSIENTTKVFSIDCIFVVDSGTQFILDTSPKFPLLPDFFDDAVTKPLKLAYKDKKRKPCFTLYQGKGFRNKYEMFSFFPSTPANLEQTNSLRCCTLSLSENKLKSIHFNLEDPPSHNNHFIYPILRKNFSVWDAWNELVNETFSQNFVLGVNAYF